MDVNVLGLMRLAQGFGPALCGRAADGVNNATAWVNVLSIYAHVNLPARGMWSVSYTHLDVYKRQTWWWRPS